MMNLFEHASSHWVRYSGYEWKNTKDGKLYLVPVPGAKPKIYDPLEEYEGIVVSALNIGAMSMSKKPMEDIQTAILQFAENYGLLGLMTALPTTSSFMDYEKVYLLKNRFLKAESLATEEYLDYFFPFSKPDLQKIGLESLWNIEGDPSMMALALTMTDKPMGVNLCFQRSYAEAFEWLEKQFKDWFFTYMTIVYYYTDYDSLDEDSRNIYRQAMAAFDGNAPTYHIALLDKPTIVWDFHSLLLGIQMMFSFMLTNDQQPLRICKKCSKVFKASRPSAVFCSPRCKNQYNVYKSRKKNEADD
jgi:hypothetical protein